MRILVTGGTGFVGSNLTAYLLKAGHEVVITGSDLEQKIPGFTGQFLCNDVLGSDWNAAGKCDAIFHQAAITDTTVYDRDEMMRANLESSRELFNYALRMGCKRIVYASSTAVYGNLPAPYREDGPVDPLNPYAESKVFLDEFAMQFAKEHPEMTIVGLRYCNVYGPGESHKGKMASMIYQLARQMMKDNPRIFKRGEQKRDYIYVEDVVQANLLALTAKESCVVNCATGRAVSFNDLIGVLNVVLGVQRTPEYIDNPYGTKYQSYIECDMTKAKEKIGFVSKFTVEEGIADYFRSGFLV